MANNDFLTIEISVERYEELVRNQERIDIARRILKADAFCNKDDILAILGEDVTKDED